MDISLASIVWHMLPIAAAGPLDVPAICSLASNDDVPVIPDMAVLAPVSWELAAGLMAGLMAGLVAYVSRSIRSRVDSRGVTSMILICDQSRLQIPLHSLSCSH